MNRFLWLFTFAFLSPTISFAQFSLQESDGSNSVKVLSKDWRLNFFSLASTETDKMQDEGGRLSTYNYFTFSTYLPKSYRFVFRVPFQYNSAGTDRFNGSKQNGQELFLQDLIVGLTKGDIMMLPWDLGIYWEGRMYLPTSPHSRKTGLITRFRNEFIVNKVVSRRFELEYDQKFSYYLQSKTAYRDQFQDDQGFTVNTVPATKRAELDHWLQAWFKFTAQSGIGWKLGGEDEFFYKSDANQRFKEPKHMVKTGPSVRFPISSDVNMIFAFDDKVDRESNLHELGQFRAKNTQFTLLTFARF